ncbi:MAG: hypothetical protein HOQ05_11405 [Corynebacteriales bacterium]|nr:hypothetical protein [Mycobacteriales bacterium]
MRTSDHLSNIEIDRVASGIAARLRGWTIQIALGGPDLNKLRREVANAVVSAAEGDWYALAEPVSPRELQRIKIVRWARQTSAVVVLVGAWALMVVQPFEVMEKLADRGLTHVILMCALGLAAIIHPRTGEQIHNALKGAAGMKGQGALSQSS